MRDDFSSKIISTVSRRAGFHCSNPQCRKLTVGANEIKDKSTLVGVAAHITAASPGGPRYDANISASERSSLENAIWLCVNCSTLIDKDETKFTVRILKEWKESIEQESSRELLKNNTESTIGNAKTLIQEEITFQQKAEIIKEQRRKQQEISSFLNSRDAILQAKNNVIKIIEKLKENKIALEDPQSGLIFGEITRGNDMYGIGFKDIFICFNWCRPDSNDINFAMLKVSIFKMEGHHGINYSENVIKIIDYKFNRNLEGEDGWVLFDSGKGFINTIDLINNWMNDFIRFAKL